MEIEGESDLRSLIKMIKEGIAILFKINKHQELTEKEKEIIPNKEKEMLFTKAKDTKAVITSSKIGLFFINSAICGYFVISTFSYIAFAIL